MIKSSSSEITVSGKHWTATRYEATRAELIGTGLATVDMFPTKGETKRKTSSAGPAHDWRVCRRSGGRNDDSAIYELEYRSPAFKKRMTTLLRELSERQSSESEQLADLRVFVRECLPEGYEDLDACQQKQLLPELYSKWRKRWANMGMAELEAILSMPGDDDEPTPSARPQRRTRRQP